MLMKDSYSTYKNLIKGGKQKTQTIILYSYISNYNKITSLTSHKTIVLHSVWKKTTSKVFDKIFIKPKSVFARLNNIKTLETTTTRKLQSNT